MKRYFGFLSVLLASTMIFTGCESLFDKMKSDNEADREEAEYDDFSEYCDELLAKWIEEDILSAHYSVSDPSDYGVEFSKDDYTLGVIDMDDVLADYETLKEELEIIESFDDDELSEEERITKACLIEYYETKLAYEGTDYLYNAFSPMNGITSALSTNFVEFAFFDEEDVELYLALLKDVPNYMESLYEFTREQAEMGYFMPDYVADQTIEACEQYLDAKDEPLLVTFEDKISKLDISKSAKEEYIATNEEYVEKYYLPVYEDTIDLMEELKGTGINDGGAVGFGKLGKQYYEAIVKEKTSDDISPKELAQYLDEAMEKVVDEMVNIYIEDEDAYNNAPYLTTDLETPEDAIEFLVENIDQLFDKPITESYVIEYQNPACEIEGVLAYYVNCRIDDVHYNSIKVNGSAVEEGSVGMYLTIAHEGYPGHLYQYTGCYGNDDTNDARKMLSFIGVTEGWAEYASICSLDLLELSDNEKRMIYLDDIYTYIVCSRLDIGINYEGWDITDTENYLSEYLYVTDDLVKDLYYSSIAEPGVYIPYTYGQLKMWELREMAEDELGKSFDVKEYHTFLSDLGIASFSVVEDELEKWIDEQ